MDVSQYLEIFIEETKEHLQSLNEHILILEKESDNQDTITEIFRAGHSLKGMAGTMGFTKMQKVTHDLENVFSEIRSGNMKVSSRLVDVLFEGIDLLEALLESIQTTSTEGQIDPTSFIEELDKTLKEGLGANGVSSDVIEKTLEEGNSKSASEKKANDDEYEEQISKLIYEEHELAAIDKAHNDNLNVYDLTIYISKDCVLKSAREYIVLRNLEEHGDIIK